MTPEEHKMLEDLADKVQKTQAPPPDVEAEDFIRKNIGSRPDALYLMTQTVLIQNMALEQAQKQIHELQQHAGQPAGMAFGTSSAGSAPRSGGAYTQSRYSSAAPPPPPQYAAPSPAPPSPSGGTGSFLRGAAQTAAGVAAGALAFEAVSSLFHPDFGYGGYMGGAPMGETIIENNYYDQPQGNQADFQDQQAGMQDVDDSGQYDDGSDYDDNGDMSGDAGFDDSGDSWT